jgi:trk system potassium uptake protein TrkA
MKVIICGAGQVGFNIARYLASQKYDVTVIDRSAELIRKIGESLDVKAMVGHASDPEQLSQAGAADADMLIAVTISDEVNMIACQIAHSLFRMPTKIARIRNQDYLKPKWRDLFSRHHLPIDVVISPELEVAKSLMRRIEVPGAFNMIPLVEEKVRVIGLCLDETCPVIDTPLRQLNELFPKLQITVMGIVRGEKIFIPRSTDQLQVGDSIYIAVAAERTERAMAVFGHEEKSAQRTIIVGGGNIGLFLSKLLEEHNSSMNLKVIEIDEKRALSLSEKLERAIVIKGDALDREILQEANIAQTDTIISVADDDEVNILSSLLGKQQGCTRAITLLNNPIYSNLVGSIGIDVTLDPREMTVSSILRHIRRGRIRDLTSICDGQAEVIEAEVIAGAEVAGKTVKELDLHGEVRFGLIIRGEETIQPQADTVLQVGDRAVLLVLTQEIRTVENLFSARADVF